MEVAEAPWLLVSLAETGQKELAETLAAVRLETSGLFFSDPINIRRDNKEQETRPSCFIYAR